MDNDKFSALMEAYGIEKIQSAVKPGLTLEEIVNVAYDRLTQGKPVFSDDEDQTQLTAWPEVIPFETHDLPAFPTDTLPGPVEAFVEALAESTQTPVEMGGLLALGVMAASVQKRYTVRVKQD